MTRLLVVGAGIFGLSTAWSAVKRGLQVELVEQAAIPNPIGSSVDQHRLIRHPYGPQGGYTRMTSDAYGAWDRLWADLGRTLYAPSGTLMFEDVAGSWLAASRTAMDACGVPHTRPSPAELARRYPALIAENFADVLAADTGGTLFAGDIVAALAGWLPAHGAILHAHAAVRDIDPNRNEVTLADGRRLSGDALVVCAGPWTNRLVPAMEARMTPSRQTILYLDPPAGWDGIWNDMPLLLDLAASGTFYLVPPRQGRGLKVGVHTFSNEGDPDEPRVADAAACEHLLAVCARRLARLDEYRIRLAKTCFYDTVADERFIVEPLGPAAYVATGFSGHGFKFGALVGERIAEAVAGGLEAAALTRWAAGH
ncbi:MAG: FAD-dependent oxidoreductase [Proteobacteria bacterium]|nr:FAD-dependent oxidoreductase [Pseudomonadota bacterium]